MDNTPNQIASRKAVHDALAFFKKATKGLRTTPKHTDAIKASKRPMIAARALVREMIGTAAIRPKRERVAGVIGQTEKVSLSKVDISDVQEYSAYIYNHYGFLFEEEAAILDKMFVAAVKGDTKEVELLKAKLNRVIKSSPMPLQWRKKEAAVRRGSIDIEAEAEQAIPEETAAM